MDDLVLLRHEMATLWGVDAYGRHEPAPDVAVAVARDGVTVRADVRLPAGVRARITADGTATDVLDRARRVLGAGATVTSGPSFLVEHATLPDTPGLLRSDAPVPPALVPARPVRWWQPGEWADLLAGALGPWAMLVADGHVRALCHTPRASGRYAEAGVWTHPDHRRRGYAGAVTAAWAVTARREYPVLFYSTSADNRASAGVARSLGLRPLGDIWQFRR
ncbi:GNAT family N-acetyltransferase [Actinocatenispora rupis]|uniref:N-acetyltransferase domain-containing protein n=1 Tax=Actinocatenispora rupis TaxID=519421 RepID=A0A8J3NAJ0_9ACTN|nr:GNAT family N-acetyltransferase [Actinocatenispora rupis]GID12156.1 hypothetical protein Aru02nite_30450 [Actinocatenispora rupis]